MDAAHCRICCSNSSTSYSEIMFQRTRPPRLYDGALNNSRLWLGRHVVVYREQSVVNFTHARVIYRGISRQIKAAAFYVKAVNMWRPFKFLSARDRVSIKNEALCTQSGAKLCQILTDFHFFLLGRNLNFKQNW